MGSSSEATSHSPSGADPVTAADLLPRRQVNVLVDAVQELSLARDLESARAIVRRAARELTQADGATFILREGDLCYYVDEDAISPLWKGQRFPVARCVSGWTMEHGRPAVIEDIYSDPRVPVDAYRPTFVKSLVMVPIRARKPIGAIGNYWARRHLATADEISLLQALAHSTSIALENIELYTGLERRVRERTAELEAANRDLEAFGYSVAHDLRAPLTVLRGWADLLATDAEAAPAIRVASSAAEAAADRMEDVIDGLLALSRAGHAPVAWEPVDLSLLARAVVEDLQRRDPARRVEVEIADGLGAMGDAPLLRIALENLIGNAWKFSSATAEPRIRFGRDAEGVYFVADNGAGFDPEAASRLFLPFQRLHPAAEFDGSGIGLATVERIVRRHGGRIWADGAPGRGATFHFTLPAPARGA
jgi:signal transduction histidine kinase